MDQAVQTLLISVLPMFALGLFIELRKTKREDRAIKNQHDADEVKSDLAIQRLIAGMRHLINLLLTRYANCSLTYDKVPINDMALAKRSNELLDAATSDTARDLGYPRDWFSV